MKEILKWRLSKLLTVDDVTTLLEKKIITPEEARQVLFNSETDESRDKDSLKAEIKFLREVVDKLADRQTTKTVVTEYITKYSQQPFYQPYVYWSSGTAVGGTYCNNITGGNSMTCTSTDGTMYVSASNTTGDSAFTNISTF